ncbi:hypothetical protein BD769DRAFT_1443811 [Suillus cothurnatus]|nr:hypothetical protein BD769DRAFT_1443811 [Suillus cothurnatus]
MFRISLSKVPLSRPIQNAQSRTVVTTVRCDIPRRADIPSPRGKISTPQDFLKAIGRSSETKISIDSWDAFWRTSGWDMKNAGLSVQDRRSVTLRLCCSLPVHHTRMHRYILWCMEKFRQNQPIEGFAHEEKPKKKIRGRGPAVQFGKRIRSRRDR